MDLGALSGVTDLAIPSGIFAALAIVVITMIKARQGDRKLMLETQQEHIATLTQERKDKDGELLAVKAKAAQDVETAEANAIEWRTMYEGEVRARIVADTTASLSAGQLQRTQGQVQELTREVERLRLEVQRLTATIEGADIVRTGSMNAVADQERA